MKVIRYRLREIDPVLYPLNDDGQPGISVIIHGASSEYNFAVRPDVNRLRCQISGAQITGQVYLLSWRSGFYSWNLYTRAKNYNSIEDNAHDLGNKLKKILLKLPPIKEHKIRLIGHSLGAHVITSSLLNNDWGDLDLRDVILMGAAIGDDDYEEYTPRQFWNQCLSQVRNKIIICYSRSDQALHLRKTPRWNQEEPIGRIGASHASASIREIDFTDKLLDDNGHDYLSCFNWVMNRIYPARKRSSDYFNESVEDVECPAYTGKTTAVNLFQDGDYWCDACRCEVHVDDGAAAHVDVVRVPCELDRRRVTVVPINNDGIIPCDHCNLEIIIKNGDAEHEEPE